jgi:hypothetical protein
MPANEERLKRQQEIERLKTEEEKERLAGHMDKFQALYQQRCALQHEEFKASARETLSAIPPAIKAAGQKAWKGVNTAVNMLDRAFTSEWCRTNLPIVSLAWFALKEVTKVAISVAKTAATIGQKIAEHLPGAIESARKGIESIGSALSQAADSVRKFDPKSAWASAQKSGYDAQTAAIRAKDYACASASYLASPVASFGAEVRRGYATMTQELASKYNAVTGHTPAASTPTTSNPAATSAAKGTAAPSAASTAAASGKPGLSSAPDSPEDPKATDADSRGLHH